MKNLCALLFGWLCLFSAVSAQQNIISGKVVSAGNNESLPGVKGTGQGTVTDVDGNYSISVGDEGTLVFSSIGYGTQEIPINGRSTIN